MKPALIILGVIVMVVTGYIVVFTKLVPGKIDPFLARMNGFTFCQNGNIMEGSPSNIYADGSYSIYTKNGWLIYSLGGWGSHSESFVYYWRKWLNQPLTCN